MVNRLWGTSPRSTGNGTWFLDSVFSNPTLAKADLFWALRRAVRSTLSKCPGENAQVATGAGLGDLTLGSNCNAFHQRALPQCTASLALKTPCSWLHRAAPTPSHPDLSPPSGSLPHTCLFVSVSLSSNRPMAAPKKALKKGPQPDFEEQSGR